MSKKEKIIRSIFLDASISFLAVGFVFLFTKIVIPSISGFTLGIICGLLCFLPYPKDKLTP